MRRSGWFAFTVLSLAMGCSAFIDPNAWRSVNDAAPGVDAGQPEDRLETLDTSTGSVLDVMPVMSDASVVPTDTLPSAPDTAVALVDVGIPDTFHPTDVLSAADTTFALDASRVDTAADTVATGDAFTSGDADAAALPDAAVDALAEASVDGMADVGTDAVTDMTSDVMSEALSVDVVPVDAPLLTVPAADPAARIQIVTAGLPAARFFELGPVHRELCTALAPTPDHLTSWQQTSGSLTYCRDVLPEFNPADGTMRLNIFFQSGALPAPVVAVSDRFCRSLVQDWQFDLFNQNGIELDWRIEALSGSIDAGTLVCSIVVPRAFQPSDPYWPYRLSDFEREARAQLGILDAGSADAADVIDSSDIASVLDTTADTTAFVDATDASDAFVSTDATDAPDTAEAAVDAGSDAGPDAGSVGFAYEFRVIESGSAPSVPSRLWGAVTQLHLADNALVPVLCSNAASGMDAGLAEPIGDNWYRCVVPSVLPVFVVRFQSPNFPAIEWLHSVFDPDNHPAGLQTRCTATSGVEIRIRDLASGSTRPFHPAPVAGSCRDLDGS